MAAPGATEQPGSSTEPTVPTKPATLELDASRARSDLDWTPRLRLDQALELLVQWYRAWQSDSDMRTFTLEQIQRYESRLQPRN